MESVSVSRLCRTAMLAALYAALSWVSATVGLGYGSIQVRISEVLCLLPFFYAPATTGLFVGCLLANILSPYGLLDMVAGSLTTLLAGYWSSRCHHVWHASLPPVLCNGVIVGLILAIQQTSSWGFGMAWLCNGLTVGLGEAVVCCGIGIPFWKWMEKRNFLKILIGNEK